MSTFREFFEGHAAFFAVVVPIVGLVGSFAGSWAAGWMQARGGRDQAAAAREAAAATNEAQRVAALWTVRQVQVAEFVQQARKFLRTSVLLYRGPLDGDLRTEVQEMREGLRLKMAELELIAPAGVDQAVKGLNEALGALHDYAAISGPAHHSYLALHEAADSSDPIFSIPGQAAIAALDEMARDLESGDVALRRQVSESATRAVSDVIGISPVKVSQVMWWARQPDPFDARRNLEGAVEREMASLVAAARVMLRSNDDVAPAVPVQRRWWRRNSATTPIGSA
ncbi:hypothetical protein [Streptomyces sp. NPDC001809]